MDPFTLMESHASRFFFIFVVLFSVVHATIPCDFPAIFNFGDSNSDTGGLSAAFGQAPPPHGESYFGGPAGRYCDGRLIIDFMAESLGLPYLNAYLDSLQSNFAHGANFATAGATIRNIACPNPFSLNVQSNQFYDFLHRPQKPHNQGIEGFWALLPEPRDFSCALYTLDIGHNDISGLFNMSKDQIATNVDDILDQFTTFVRKIYGQGGRSFWIHNVGPLGCLAAILNDIKNTSTQIDEAGCSIPQNEIVQYYNLKLKETVVQLRKNLTLAAITYVDIYAAKYSLFSHAKENGFEDPFQVCCGHGGKYNYNPNIRCGSNGIENGRHIFAGKCEDPSVRINWDGPHYTQAANKWVFDRIVDGSFSDPPIPLEMACHRPY